ncbi:MAG: radical SAM family heme chaperone HemW [Candidatus Hydrogenedentes bacterium]|nr:radical SAM family heme chaperone HemW [Candidatus Hydrogenedentota bacterium]
MAAPQVAAAPAVIGIYLHIPYCRTLCPYCDFVRNPIDGAVPQRFVDAVCGEIAAFEGPDKAGTVFFGGGTPSLLAPASLERILAAVGERFVLEEPEVSIEANPDDVRGGLADAWRALGVTRVSLGVQSFDDGVLGYLGRRHDAATARQACGAVAERFDNWGMDLIFGAQPVDAWDATLAECAALAPKHVSVYGLTYEAATPFAARAGDAVDDDTYLELYWRAEAHLAGFEHYEVSNYAQPGRECRHNLIYWNNLEYAGFGPGAYSFVGGIRARNPVALNDYLAHPGGKCEALRLSDAEVRTETLIQHFRLAAGIRKAAYAERFGRAIHEDYGHALDGLVARGLIEEDREEFRPTRRGFELNNEIGLALVHEGGEPRAIASEA